MIPAQGRDGTKSIPAIFNYANSLSRPGPDPGPLSQLPLGPGSGPGPRGGGKTRDAYTSSHSRRMSSRVRKSCGVPE
jgi:hypothetical protein